MIRNVQEEETEKERKNPTEQNPENMRRYFSILSSTNKIKKHRSLQSIFQQPKNVNKALCSSGFIVVVLLCTISIVGGQMDRICSTNLNVHSFVRSHENFDLPSDFFFLHF